MKNIFKLLTLVIVLLVAAGCTERPFWYQDYTGEGDVYVQVVGESLSFGLYVDGDDVPVTDSIYPIYVKLLGPAQSTDVTVGFTITSSTGDNGEWSFESLQTTIPAGSLSSMIEVTIHKNPCVIDSVYVVELALDEAVTTADLYTNGFTTTTLSLVKALSCQYDPNDVEGSWHSVSDDWASEGDITITIDEDDSYIIYVAGLETMEGLEEDNGPLPMIIDPDPTEPNVYAVSAPKHILASSLAPWGLSYTNIAYGGSGYYYSCEDRFEMVFEITVDQGSWGENGFIFTKN